MLSITSSLVSQYPGAIQNWELLWVQNIVLVFIQFATAAALFTQNTRYAQFLTAPLESFLGYSGRQLLLGVHVVGGVLLVAINVVFVFTWISSSPSSVTTLLTERPVITWTTLFLVTSLVVMAVFGVSMYANIRPDTRFPVWRFDYALSRKVHRGLFVAIVAVLGHHIFFTPRVYFMWEFWVQETDPYGLLVLGIIFLWGILVGQSVVMVLEWLTGRFFSKWTADFSGVASGIGGVLAVGFALLTVFTEFTTDQVFQGIVLVAVVSLVLLTVRSGGLTQYR